MIIKKLNGKIVKKRLYTAILSGLLSFPLLWSITPSLMGVFSPLPFAGPELLVMGKIGNTGDPMASFMPGFMGEKKTYERLISFLIQNRTNEKYLLSVPSVTTYGSPLMLYSDYPIMLLGGFTGEDVIYSLEVIQEMTTNGIIRFFIVSDLPKGKNKDIYEWIKKTGKPVQKEIWSLYPTKDELYDLRM